MGQYLDLVPLRCSGHYTSTVKGWDVGPAGVVFVLQQATCASLSMSLSQWHSLSPVCQATHCPLSHLQDISSLMAQLGAVVAVACSFFCASLFSAVHKIEEGHIGVYYR